MNSSDSSTDDSGDDSQDSDGREDDREDGTEAPEGEGRDGSRNTNEEEEQSSSTSSYAGSDAETLSEETFSSTEYVTNKILQAFDSMALDKAVVIQAKRFASVTLFYMDNLI